MKVIGIKIYNSETKNMINAISNTRSSSSRLTAMQSTFPATTRLVKEASDITKFNLAELERIYALQKLGEMEHRKKASNRYYFLPLSKGLVAVVKIDYGEQGYQNSNPENDQKIRILWAKLRKASNAGTLSRGSNELEEIFKNPLQDHCTHEERTKVGPAGAETTQRMDTPKSHNKHPATSSKVSAYSAAPYTETKPPKTWPKKTLTTVGLFSTGFIIGTVGAAALLMGKVTSLFIACCAGGYAICFLMIAYGLFKLIRENAAAENNNITPLSSRFC